MTLYTLTYPKSYTFFCTLRILQIIQLLRQSIGFYQNAVPTYLVNCSAPKIQPFFLVEYEPGRGVKSNLSVLSLFLQTRALKSYFIVFFLFLIHDEQYHAGCRQILIKTRTPPLQKKKTKNVSQLTPCRKFRGTKPEINQSSWRGVDGKNDSFDRHMCHVCARHVYKKRS